MNRSPVVIFGTGGSGTRVVARIVGHAGCHLGDRLNIAEDSLELASFLDQWVEDYLSLHPWTDLVLSGTRLIAGGGGEFDRMAGEFHQALLRHGDGRPDNGCRWGWKTPRSIYLLPFLHQQFPNLLALHLVRDGRDMAYSTNQNQLRKHGGHFLDKAERALPEVVQSIILWSRINLAAALYGEAHLGENYLRMRFEDLCRAPKSAALKIFEFVGAPDTSPAKLAEAALEIATPETIGRYQQQDREETAIISRAGDRALRHFGYLETTS